MAIEKQKDEEFFSELEVKGEEQVRNDLATDRYGTTNSRKKLAEEWLRKKERSRRETVSSESLATAKAAASEASRASNAAERAATAAEAQADTAARALLTAKAALIIAIIVAVIEIIRFVSN